MSARKFKVVFKDYPLERIQPPPKSGGMIFTTLADARRFLIECESFAGNPHIIVEWDEDFGEWEELRDAGGGECLT